MNLLQILKAKTYLLPQKQVFLSIQGFKFFIIILNRYISLLLDPNLKIGS